MWFLQWVSLANTVLPTEIIICRFADEWGGVPPPHTPPVAPPLVKRPSLVQSGFVGWKRWLERMEKLVQIQD